MEALNFGDIYVRGSSGMQTEAQTENRRGSQLIPQSKLKDASVFKMVKSIEQKYI